VVMRLYEIKIVLRLQKGSGAARIYRNARERFQNMQNMTLVRAARTLLAWRCAVHVLSSSHAQKPLTTSKPDSGVLRSWLVACERLRTSTRVYIYCGVTWQHIKDGSVPPSLIQLDMRLCAWASPLPCAQERSADASWPRAHSQAVARTVWALERGPVWDGIGPAETDG